MGIWLKLTFEQVKIQELGKRLKDAELERDVFKKQSGHANLFVSHASNCQLLKSGQVY
jgi:hypothetical protein